MSVKTYAIMKKTALLFIGLLLVMASCQPSKDTQKTLLWKISGNGLQKPSYLFGTWHGDTQLRGSSFLDSIPHCYNALDSVEVFAGEVVTVRGAIKEIDTEYQKNLFKKAVMPGDTLIGSLLDEGQVAKLDSFLQKNLHLDYAQLNLRPSMVMYLLGQLFIEKRVSENIQKEIKALDSDDSLFFKKIVQLQNGRDVMDRYLQKYAYSHKKEIVGLDELSGSGISEIMVMFLSRKPLKEEADSLLSFICQVDSADYIKLVEQQAEGMRKAYREQDIFKVYEEKGKQLQELNDLNPGDSLALEKLMKEILTDRNHNWMKVIPGIIKEKSTFIAVGAVHLGGEEGLINLLKKEGYTVEPMN